MRVLLAVLLVGIAGCGGEDTSPGDVAAPASTEKAAGVEDLSDAELADLLQAITEAPADQNSDDAVAEQKAVAKTSVGSRTVDFGS